MKKRKLGLLIGTIALLGVIIATLALWSKHLSPLTPGQYLSVMRSNEVRSVVITARSAAKRLPITTLITVDGADHEFPLPHGTTDFGEKYLICSDEFAPYLERLPSYGYELEEQLGSMYHYRNAELGVLVLVMSQQWHGNMSLFYYEVME